MYFGVYFLFSELVNMSLSPSFKVPTVLQNPAQSSSFGHPPRSPSPLCQLSHPFPHSLALGRGLLWHFPRPEMWGPLHVLGAGSLEGSGQASLGARSAALARGQAQETWAQGVVLDRKMLCVGGRVATEE